MCLAIAWAELLAADPALDPAEAVASVVAARRAAEAARAGGQRPPAGQLALPRPTCPPDEFDRLAGHLRAAAAILAVYRLDAYQAGSARLLLDRLEQAFTKTAGAGAGSAAADRTGTDAADRR